MFRRVAIVPTLLRFSGAREHDSTIEEWLATKPSDLASIARTWFDVMRACGSDVRELVHDGFATACVDDAPFAYVGVFKAHVNVGFFQGSTLADPDGLLEGTGKFMRHVKLKPGVAYRESSLEALIVDAYRDIVAKLESSK